ncbi:MAG: primosomal protein N' [Patescibacteria group bacterium]
MFCEIVLSQRFPKNLGIFDYEVPFSFEKTIKVGQLVTIPFRNSMREGIVIKIKQQGIEGKKIKPLAGRAQTSTLLTPEQVALAEWISRYYSVSLGTVIKMILPSMPKRMAGKKSPGAIHRVKYGIAREAASLARQAARNLAREHIFLPCNPDEHDSFIGEIARSVKKHLLIIVPGIQDIGHIKSLFPRNLQKKTAIIHSKLNKSDYYRAYQSIQDSDAAITVGTKLALFMPYKKLGHIIIDQEDDQNHKQADQNPRYDSRTAAEQLARLHGAQLMRISPAPTVVSFSRGVRKTANILTTGNPPKTKLQLIDMREEHKKRNYSLFSDLLQSEVDAALRAKKQVLLFLNKRGSSSAVLCNDCGSSLSCSTCSLPLIYHEKENALYCHRCNKKSMMPPCCPRCSGAGFTFTGTGTQKVEREVRKRWPSASSARFDADTELNTVLHGKDIIIGTIRILNHLDWQSVGLTGVISADTFLHLPDFRSSERTFQLLRKLQYLNQSSLVVQTYSPDNAALRHFLTGEHTPFYQHELREREAANYPPYGSLLKLIYSSRDKEQCLREAQRLYRMLKFSKLDVMLLTPLRPFQQNRWRMYVIVKFKSEEDQPILAMAADHVPHDWIIDRDPETLL